VIPNQGARRGLGAHRDGSTSLPRIFFNDATTESGRDALGWYHEKKSNDDLGPNHDWSSHADAFGLMCVHYDQPDGAPPPRERYRGRQT
jgi:phage terminase large subunit